MITAYKFGLIVTDKDFADDDETNRKEQTKESFDENIHENDHSVTDVSG